MIIGMFDLYIYMYIKYIIFYLNKSKIFIKVLALRLYFRNNFCKWKKQIFYRVFKRFYTFTHIHLIRGSLCVSCRNTTIFLNNNNNKTTLNPLSYTNSLWAQNLKKKQPKAYESSRFQVGVSKGSAKVRTTYHLTGSCYHKKQQRMRRALPAH